MMSHQLHHHSGSYSFGMFAVQPLQCGAELPVLFHPGCCCLSRILAERLSILMETVQRHQGVVEGIHARVRLFDHFCMCSCCVAMLLT